ncbi:GAF domain-containing protein [Haloarchaeobius sp. HME9146]|uniref:GAF domain-containing protein n=1 Tax=Haloarchaeobius sp. HME9146 TaxID=2978732 RepID=UPI0021BE78AC|nr:GAF domain-containing protein [Haloarchaeobius sp. HME9146]MCT9096380.1 GAF domain-containing protein [Haloarchaeobius sp. HME9146]
MSDGTQRPSRYSLLYDVADAVERADSFEDAVSAAITLVCDRTVWQYAETWVPVETDDGDLVAEPGPVWYGTTGDLRTFRAVSRHFSFPRGVGLVGRAWETGDIEWVRDASKSEPGYFRRAAVARDAGLRAGIAAPVTDGENTVAILVFFRRDGRERNRTSIHLVGAVAKLLGLVARIERAEREARGRAAAQVADEHSMAGLDDSGADQLGDGPRPNAPLSDEAVVEAADDDPDQDIVE